MLARSGGPARIGEDNQKPIAATANSYSRSVCGKALPSYQALGGHKASHRARPPTTSDYPPPLLRTLVAGYTSSPVCTRRSPPARLRVATSGSTTRE
ncbi:hypothetical protein CASFOL_036392 [Castilleja foliolosa]|uniref:C2H2-type domain-containing protein n=1 Tax=Castilleja foliolosa TaxID=1961234 RepID=A0ABD3BVE7_9LAMI